MELQSKSRLLVVDDDRKLAGLIRDYLTPMGYDVELRHNGPDGLAEAIASPYEAADLDVDVSVPPSTTVLADPRLLERALGNLIRNASTHAGPGAKVTIRAVETADAVSLTVADDGPGVPVAELSRIFEPFYRLDRSRSRDTGGSGLGLAIVRTAIETYGGEVAASLPESGGFAVTVRFPIRVPQTRRL